MIIYSKSGALLNSTNTNSTAMLIEPMETSYTIPKPTMKLYVTYEDKGPKGVCGQDAYTTSCWKKLYVFQGTYEEIRDKLEQLESDIYKSSRMFPKLTHTYWDDPDEFGQGNDVYYL